MKHLKLFVIALGILPILFASSHFDDEQEFALHKKSCSHIKHATEADAEDVDPITLCDFLIPNITFLLFGQVDLDPQKLLWNPTILQKLSFGQLMALVKDGEISSKNLFLIPFAQIKQKIE